MRAVRRWPLLLAIIFILAGCSVDELNNALAPVFSQQTSSEAPRRVVSGNRSTVQTSSGAAGGTAGASGAAGSSGEQQQTAPEAQEQTPPEMPVEDDLERPPLFYPYRAMLSDDQKRAYDEVCERVGNMENVFNLETHITRDKFPDVFNAVRYDNPQFFWLDSQCSFNYNISDGSIIQVEIEFNETANYIDRARDAFESAANEILQGAMSQTTDVEKIKYVHDALLSRTDMVDGSPMNQSAYSAFVNRKTVCAGYTRAMQYLLMQMNIPSYFCEGYTNEAHAWNINKIGDDFYNLDMTWDDPVGNPPDVYHYEYFNLTDKQLAVDHRRTNMSVNLPACNGTTYGYDEYFGSADPMQRVQKGGALLSLSDFGYTEQDVVQSAQDYYNICRDTLLEGGKGEYEDFFVLKSEAVYRQIYVDMTRPDWYDLFVSPSASELGLQTYGASITESSARPLANGYYLYNRKLSFY